MQLPVHEGNPKGGWLSREQTVDYKTAPDNFFSPSPPRYRHFVPIDTISRNFSRLLLTNSV